MKNQESKDQETKRSRTKRPRDQGPRDQETKDQEIMEVMPNRNDLSERLLKFAVNIILYLRTVKNSIETMDMKRQLIKCSTSSGANYEEAQGSITKADAKNKISISLKEMRETNYFLKVFHHLKLGEIQQCAYLSKESSELKLILAAIINKL